ncbi:hypothetical protein ACJX0J_010063, partial [Zea mays]
MNKITRDLGRFFVPRNQIFDVQITSVSTSLATYGHIPRQHQRWAGMVCFVLFLDNNYVRIERLGGLKVFWNKVHQFSLPDRVISRSNDPPYIKLYYGQKKYSTAATTTGNQR